MQDNRAGPLAAEPIKQVMLLLDCSGGMGGEPMQRMKRLALELLRRLDRDSDQLEDGLLGGGIRAGAAGVLCGLGPVSGPAASLSGAVALVTGLEPGGSSCQLLALRELWERLEGCLAVLMSDGMPGEGPALEREALPEGCRLICVGIPGASGLCSRELSAAATEGYFELLQQEELPKLAAELSARVMSALKAEGVAEATKPPKGNAEPEPGPAAGGDSSEEEIFMAEKMEPETRCDIQLDAGCCYGPFDISAEGCQDLAVLDAGEIAIGCTGRVVQLQLTLKNVCPGRRVALAASLTELDSCSVEQRRGFKMLMLPAHSGSCCQDMQVRGICFLLPEDPGLQCQSRRFRVRIMADYLDCGPLCC